MNSKILLTGSSGYIGKRLLPELLNAGYEVYALVRSKARFEAPLSSKLHVIEADLFDPQSLKKIPKDIVAAYYLVHSMKDSKEDFIQLEAEAAKNFSSWIATTKARQVIYLSGLCNEENLSPHLASRKNVDAILRESPVPVTTLMAGIIIGSGSASFEIIRDLVEKLPFMIAPKWVNNQTQPIAIRDVLDELLFVLLEESTFGQHYEIGGPEIFTYKELLLRFAKIRGLKRKIFTVPVLTPRLSSYWLYFITSASYSLASTLVESLKNNAICKENQIRALHPKKMLSFDTAVKRALDFIEDDRVPSSWKDAFTGSRLSPNLFTYIHVPEFGTLVDHKKTPFEGDAKEVEKAIWSLGGRRGWLFMDWAWRFRGFLDKLVGGVGLRRGRTKETQLKPGDALDFWRVIIAEHDPTRLLLYAEMRLPGEAWLEFRVHPSLTGGVLEQTATFYPKGILGRLYWYLIFPFHWLIFRGMAKAICRQAKSGLTKGHKS